VTPAESPSPMWRDAEWEVFSLSGVLVRSLTLPSLGFRYSFVRFPLWLPLERFVPGVVWFPKGMVEYTFLLLDIPVRPGLGEVFSLALLIPDGTERTAECRFTMDRRGSNTRRYILFLFHLSGLGRLLQ